MKKSFNLILLLILLSISVSCNSEEKTKKPNIEEQNEDEIEDQIEKEKPEKIEKEPSEEDLMEIEKNNIANLKKKGYIKSLLNGKYYEKDKLNQRPVSVMYDNHPYARWQAGLSKAEIVYECEVEFPFTRYMAVFQSDTPKHIGPVRSARPYYLKYALEYDSIYVHVGGSNDAMAKINSYYMADVDGLYSGNFWRYNDTGKSIPNNMYTDMKNIREAQVYYGYREEGEFEGYPFKDISEKIINDDLEINSCKRLNLIFNQHYEIEFEYDEEKNSYTRYVNGEKHVDEYYEDEILASNIIIIETTRQVLDDAGRLAVNTVGQGEGYYITMNQIIDITWEKPSYSEKTYFYDESGSEIIFNPGQTWIEVITQKTSFNYEEEENV